MAPTGGTGACLGALTDATTKGRLEMTIYRNTYKLGLGHTAILVVDEEAPLPMPVGADWEAEIDYVRVAATVILPTDVTGWIHDDLLGCNTHVAGILITQGWGDHCPVGRQRVIRLSAETLADAVAAVRHKVECDIADLRSHVAAREARIALRESRIARGRAILPPKAELVARFNVTGLPQGEIAALAAEVAAQGEACEEHPDVTVRMEMPDSAFPTHCVDPTEAPTARIRVPLSDAVPEFDDWGQPTTPRSGPPD